MSSSLSPLPSRVCSSMKFSGWRNLSTISVRSGKVLPPWWSPIYRKRERDYDHPD